jgi:alkylated DNA repair dioxygenase AlkB
LAAQLALFADRSPDPPGLRYQGEFISRDDERALIARFAELPLAPFQFGAFEGKRRVASFGVRYDFSDQRLHMADGLPDWIVPIARRVEQYGGAPAGSVAHVLFTEYQEGVGIGWHRDKAAFELVFGLSLGSSCRLRFRKKEGSTYRRATLEAEPRSLYLMTGEARRVWEHSIPPVEALRYSITFRTLAAR